MSARGDSGSSACAYRPLDRLITLPSDYKVVSIRYNYKGQETGPVWKTAKKLQNGGVLPIGKDTVLMVEYAPKSGKSLYNRSYILHINRV